MSAKNKGRKGQTILETAILLMIIVFAFLAMQAYLKRSIQGRLWANIDSIGEQYDPLKTTSDYNMTRVSNVTTTSTSTEQPTMTFWGQPAEDRLVTVVESQTHYDNTVKSGYEYVAGP
jgi:uncharacterized protein (UPF0333 family)